MVAEKFRPKVSEKKRAELENQIKSLKTSPKTRLSPIEKDTSQHPEDGTHEDPQPP